MATDYVRLGIRIAMELWLEKDWLVEEHLDLLFDAGYMNNTEHVLKVIEEEEAYVLYPIIVKLLQRDIMELKEELRTGEC